MYLWTDIWRGWTDEMMVDELMMNLWRRWMERESEDGRIDK